MQNQMKSMIGAVILILAMPTNSCGERDRDQKQQGQPLSKVEQLIQTHATANGIPPRYLMAIGLYESNLTPVASRVPYLSTEQTQLGFTVTETAFGISRAKLGLTDHPSPDELNVQIESYAKWLGAALKELNLPANPTAPVDKFNWLTQLALQHRLGNEYSKENQVIWALGLIELLNTGAVWQDPSSGETLELSRENPPIQIQDFPPEGQKYFDLELDKGEVKFTKQLELITPSNNHTNKPTHIEIIHCPMNLSACIEIQNLMEGEDTARLRAHYIIPQDDSVVSQPIQVTPHEYALELTGNDGSVRLVDNALVVMLVGNSGRYDSNGYRINANPTWFTPWQLQELGKLAHRLCYVISKANESITRERCLSSRVENGLRFHSQGPQAESYRWGEIPDYDETIFNQYIQDTDTQAAAVFVFPIASKRLHSGIEFDFDVRFPITTRRVLLERAIRCPNQKLVWATVQSSAVKGKVEKRFQTEILDAGPNQDGHHFLRAMAYDAMDKLVAWAIDDIFIQNYEPQLGSGEVKACIRNGT
jgi:hypothetical protein